MRLVKLEWINQLCKKTLFCLDKQNKLKLKNASTSAGSYLLLQWDLKSDNLATINIKTFWRWGFKRPILKGRAIGMAIALVPTIWIPDVFAIFKILTKWHLFARISNGPTSGFQFTLNIWSIYKPTSFWPNFGESGSRLEVHLRGEYLCVLNEIGKREAWIANADYGCVNSNTWPLFNVVFNLK